MRILSSTGTKKNGHMCGFSIQIGKVRDLNINGRRMALNRGHEPQVSNSQKAGAGVPGVPTLRGKTTIILNMLTRADSFPYADGSFYWKVVVVSEKTDEPEWQRLLTLYPGRFEFYTELTEEVFDEVKSRQNKEDGMYLIVTDDTADQLNSCGINSRIIKRQPTEQG